MEKSAAQFQVQILIISDQCFCKFVLKFPFLLNLVRKRGNFSTYCMQISFLIRNMFKLRLSTMNVFNCRQYIKKDLKYDTNFPF